MLYKKNLRNVEFQIDVYAQTDGQTDRQTDDRQMTVYINNRVPAVYYR